MAGIDTNKIFYNGLLYDTTDNSGPYAVTITGNVVPLTGGGSATPVVDNLTSTSTTSALSAKQGSVLKGLADASVTLTGTQTVTNKTLTSPVINTPTGIVKGDVGLGNVDNTSDVNKPVSTAQSTAIALKANTASPSFTGSVTQSGASVLVPYAMTGTVINTAAASNTKSISADTTLTMSGTPATGTCFSVQINNTDTASHTVTFPTSWSLASNSSTAPVYTVAPSGLIVVAFQYDGTRYICFTPGTGSSSNMVYRGASTGLPTTTSMPGLTAGNKAYVTDSNAPCEAIWTGSYWKPIGEVVIGQQLSDITVTESGSGYAEAYAGFNCPIPMWMPQAGGELVAFVRLVGAATAFNKTCRIKIGTVATDINGTALGAAGNANSSALEFAFEGRANFISSSSLQSDNQNATTFSSLGQSNFVSTTSINFSTTQAYVKATLALVANATSMTIKSIKISYRPGI